MGVGTATSPTTAIVYAHSNIGLIAVQMVDHGGNAADADCRASGAVHTLVGTFSGFPSNEAFVLFATVTEGGKTSVFDGVPIPTGSSGAASANVTSLSNLPARVGFVVYRANDDNMRWDPDTDDTFFRGNAVVSRCPQSLTVAPK